MLTATIIGILSVPVSVLWNNSLNRASDRDSHEIPVWTGDNVMKYIPIIGLICALGRSMGRTDPDGY